MPKLTLEVFDDGRSWHKPLLRSIDDGLQGNLETLRIGADFVLRDEKLADVRAFVANCIVGNVAGHDYKGEIRACFEYARNRIRYRQDPVEVERVMDLWSAVAFGEGDCFIKSVALATCLACLGHRPFFIPIIQIPNDKAFNHVYVGVYSENGSKTDKDGNRFEPLDPTPEDKPQGWSASAWCEMKYEIFEN
jgi:hypothetical protein